MQLRQLGKTDLFVSELGYGCASYWGMKYFSQKEAFALVNYAIDNGINIFDTGHSYSSGNAEVRLGEFLKTISPATKQKLIISSKAGTRNGRFGRTYKDFSPAWIKTSVAMSLNRLGLDHLPLLHLHGPQVKDLTDELLSTLTQLRKNGVYRALCINSFDTDVIEATMKIPEIDCIMLDYNILRQDRKVLISQLVNAGKAVIGGGSLANHAYVHPLKKIAGLRDLWYLLRSIRNHRKAIRDAQVFSWINQVKGISANQIALKYVVSNPQISSAFFGTTRLKHLKENIDSLEVKLPEELITKLENSFTLLRAQS